jgi:transposase
LGNPIKLIFTGGQVHDSKVAIELLEGIDITKSRILGDKAFGSEKIRNYILSHGGQYTIPPKSNNPDPWYCDWWHYKERHVVECFFLKLKQFRRVATRYDKLIGSFKAFVYLACCMILLK